MATNLDRFAKDLDRLIALGERLRIAMIKDATKDDSFTKQVEKAYGKKEAIAYIKTLPEFKLEYESWYSEAVALLKQLLPDRVPNFIGLYEKPKSRKAIEYGNYVIQDYMQGLRVSYLGETKVDTSAAIPQFDQQVAILKAAKTRFNSTLFEIRQLVQADLFDSELLAARELLKHKFLRAAGVIAGVVLEKHLQQVCSDHGVKSDKKKPTLADFNELLKANGTIDVAQWRRNAFLGDIRNKCAHIGEKDPTVEQVSDLVDGVDKVLKTVF